MRVLYHRNGSDDGPVLLVHGGAGSVSDALDPEEVTGYHDGLASALNAGAAPLAAGRGALEAVCAAVTVLEDDPLFNAGHGACLTSEGTVELDAAVMTGAGDAGAIAASRFIRNPILGARAVMAHTGHVLLVNPSAALASEWGVATTSPEYFVTEHRRRQLRSVLERRQQANRHGTVGAVAVDAEGAVACATSTGGMVGQSVGRVGDTPLIGAGSFAEGDTVAVSCTGDGEAFIRGAVSADIAARIRYGGSDLAHAVGDAYARSLDARAATGGTIAVTPSSDAFIGFNSEGMFAGYWTARGSRTFVARG